ncbi:hypothetical protein [Flavobacterium sp. XGLA_31]|uniref:hypothetical protein n=1 Tax=Flavobacterium sp. XGLA_31 TaxID=3447666 RepID=UPI003F366E5A
MGTKRFLAWGKIGVLLLLWSTMAVAKTVVPGSLAPETKALTLVKGKPVLAKELLQPQVLLVRVGVEHAAKPMPSGDVVLTGSLILSRAVHYSGTATTVLQDVDRCESVSRYLFPYHFFW